MAVSPIAYLGGPFIFVGYQECLRVTLQPPLAGITGLPN